MESAGWLRSESHFPRSWASPPGLFVSRPERHGRGPRRHVGSFVASGDSADSRPADQRSLEHCKHLPAGGRWAQPPFAAFEQLSRPCVRTFTHGSAYCGTWLSASRMISHFALLKRRIRFRGRATQPALPPVFSTLWWPRQAYRCPYHPEARSLRPHNDDYMSARSLPSSGRSGSGTSRVNSLSVADVVAPTSLRRRREAAAELWASVRRSNEPGVTQHVPLADPARVRGRGHGGTSRPDGYTRFMHGPMERFEPTSINAVAAHALRARNGTFRPSP